MPDQLSLFPSGFAGQSESPCDRAPDDRPTDLPPVDEVFETGRAHRQPADYQTLLDFILRFPQYSPLNAFLLYTQNPSATLVATAATWDKVYHRRPKSGARPLIILAPMSPVVFVYDVAATEGASLPVYTPKGMELRGILDDKVYEHTIANSALHGIETRDISRYDRPSDPVMQLTGRIRESYHALDISPAASYLILVDSTKSTEYRYASIVYGLSRIFCGHLGIDRRAWWPDRRGFSTASESTEADSVTYLVCGRKGLKETIESGVAACDDMNRNLPRFSLHTILQVVGYIEEMGKSRWNAPKRKSRYK